MITYKRLAKKAELAKNVIGMTLAEFDELYKEFEKRYNQKKARQEYRKGGQKKRSRGVGGGRKHTYVLKERLLMTLFWLRVYITYSLLGFLYELNKTTIEDNLKDILETLETMSKFNLERPERKRLRTIEEVMDAYPEVRLVIDAKEQRIERPANKKDNEGKVIDCQKSYYSGKKKTHTLKNQIAVAPNGRIEHLSASVPGSHHDLTLLRQTDLLAQLADGEAAMMDKGYDGITADYPNKKLHLPFKARRNHPLTEEQKAYNRFFSQYRIVVEHTNAQLNRFQVLAQRFRHSLGSHTRIIRIVCYLINRHLQLVPLKQYTTA